MAEALIQSEKKMKGKACRSNSGCREKTWGSKRIFGRLKSFRLNKSYEVVTTFVTESA